jgi:hypothetical protein
MTREKFFWAVAALAAGITIGMFLSSAVAR